MSHTNLRKEPVSYRYYSTIQMVLMGFGLGVISAAYVALLVHLIGQIQ